MSAVSSAQTDVAEEATLIERARANDYAAYEVLYRRHVGRVFALCLRLLIDHDLAEDMTQEAFIQAWKFRGESAFGSWLYRIATNTVLSHMRRQKPFKNSLDADEIDFEYRETQAEQIGLEQAIGKLPDGARTVFVLYSLEGYTHDEISRALAIAPGSSKAQLHRARQLLKAQLS